MANDCCDSLEDAQNIFADANALAKDCDYDLSDNQLRFIQDAIMAEYDVDFTYSGRGMYGQECPSVRLARGETFSSEANIRTDSLGLGTVVYAQE